MFKSQYFRNSKISTKFIFWFLLIALVPLIIAIYISYNSSRGVLEDEATKRIMAVADNKANQIQTYLREKERDLTQLSLISDLTDAVETFNMALEDGDVNSPRYRAVERKFRPLLAYYQKSFDYDDLLLVSSKGKIVFSVKNREDVRSVYEIALNEGSGLAEVFAEVKKSLKTKISGFEFSKQTSEAVAFIVAPILKEGDAIGAVVAKMNNQGIKEFVQDFSGLGETGETIVATKIGNEVAFVTPLRFDANAEFTRRIKIGERLGLGVQQAVEKKEGSGRSVDYQGKEVLAIWRYLPSFQLGMVVKMDIVEIFSSAKRLRKNLLVVSFVLLVIVIIAAVIIAHTISNPINELTRISSIITQGNLSERATIDTEDEIGELAWSFNQMTDSLIEAKANVEEERAKLQEQKKLLEKANQELDSFVYIASHDLTAPLRAISRFSSFLEEDCKEKLDDESKSNLDGIHKGADRMKQLIEDLLTLSRISRIKNPYEDVNINDLTTSVAGRLALDIKENKVDLRIQEKMPIVRCDRIKMEEVFLNLVNNTIKFSSKNSNKKENPKIEIGCESNNEYFKFFVKDNGIGIESEYHKEVFGIFRRLHTSSQYEGTGAGLSIVKRVIDDHGGKIWIDSKLGEGACFYFTIPKKV